jgi:hypothetical protein
MAAHPAEELETKEFAHEGDLLLRLNLSFRSLAFARNTTDNCGGGLGDASPRLDAAKTVAGFARDARSASSRTAIRTDGGRDYSGRVAVCGFVIDQLSVLLKP